MLNKIKDLFQQKCSWTIKDLESRLHLKSGSEFKSLIRTLNELEEGRYIYNDHAKYVWIDESYIIGKIKDVSRFEYQVIVDRDTKYTISKRGLPRLFDQDEVLIKKDKRQVKLIKVFSRGFSHVVGTYYQRHKKLTFVSMQDYHCKFHVINEKDFTIKKMDRVVCVVVEYGDVMKLRIEQILGKAFDPGMDITSILYRLNVRQSFNKQIEKEVNRLPQKVMDDDFQGRVDYRDLLTFTIDGDDARDFDDAISIEKKASGYTLYVHIADVAHYVKENGSIDKEAYQRSTSVYVCDRVVPMLPFALSNGICSLNPDVDRCTLTCKMEIDRTGACTSYIIHPSLIHSNCRCTYGKVNELLAGFSFPYPEVNQALFDLRDCCELLEARSKDRGTIDFATKEAKIVLDEKKKAVDVVVKNRGVSEQMIEECMILANVCVANYLDSHGLPGMYRVHEKPDPKKVMHVCNVANLMGLEHELYPDDIKAKDFQVLLDSIEDEQAFEVMSMLSLRAMQKARYDAHCLGHFGLALDQYCHFTSPIRRYSDLVVHRMLYKYCFNEGNKKEIPADIDKIEKQSLQVSQKEREAVLAERTVDDYKKAEYMSSRIGKVFKATIVGVQSFGFFVEMDNTVEGLVPITSLYDDFYHYDEDTLRLVGETTNKVYQLGQSVKVVCWEVNLDKGQITFALKSL